MMPGMIKCPEGPTAPEHMRPRRGSFCPFYQQRRAVCKSPVVLSGVVVIVIVPPAPPTPRSISISAPAVVLRRARFPERQQRQEGGTTGAAGGPREDARPGAVHALERIPGETVFGVLMVQGDGQLPGRVVCRPLAEERSDPFDVFR